MSKSNLCETSILELVFQNDATGFWADLSDAVDDADTAGTLTVALHSTSPGVLGDQSTNELGYSGYSRIAVARSSAEWTVTNDTVTNANNIDFGANGGSAVTARFVSVGTGTGNEMLVFAPLALADSAPFVVEDAGLVGNTIILPGHGLIADDQVVFTETAGQDLPTGITAGVYYYVMSSPGADSFSISTAAGDSGAVDITAIGSGRVAQVAEVVIDPSDEPRIAAGQFRYTTD